VRRKTLVLTGVAVAVVAATGGAVVGSSADEAPPAAHLAAANTAKVEKGDLSAMVSQGGTLTYRARLDGSPYSVINQADGIYTELPDEGDKVACGDVLYRVDDKPILLLCGTVPAYRDLHMGDEGQDVRQLNRNLHVPDGDQFTSKTQKALEQLQHDEGLEATGELALDAAVFLPASARVAKVTGELGGPAHAGTAVAQATSDTLEVQVNLDASQQGEVKVGDRAEITLPGNRLVKGKVDRLGRVAESVGQDASAGAATIPAYIGLDHPGQARGLDKAPVQVDITTKGVENAMSVPVTAIVGKSGGGFAVEVVRAGGRRDLVAVRLGLFDTGGGRVQVDGALHEGDRVAVPSL
jgi:hypothetical protein